MLHSCYKETPRTRTRTRDANKQTFSHAGTNCTISWLNCLRFNISVTDSLIPEDNPLMAAIRPPAKYKLWAGRLHELKGKYGEIIKL